MLGSPPSDPRECDQALLRAVMGFLITTRFYVDMFSAVLLICRARSTRSIVDKPVGLAWHDDTHHHRTHGLPQCCQHAWQHTSSDLHHIPASPSSCTVKACTAIHHDSSCKRVHDVSISSRFVVLQPSTMCTPPRVTQRWASSRSTSLPSSSQKRLKRHWQSVQQHSSSG